MYKNYFTIAIRTIWKNKLFSAINIAGLAIGISASLVIYLLVNYHFSFDQFQKNNDRIYRVVSNFNFSGEIYRNSGVTDPLAGAVSREVTGLDAVIPFRTWNGEAKIAIGGSGNQPKVFKHQNNIVFADSNYFGLMGYTWLAGSQKNAMFSPYQTVLTASNAALYFPGVAPADIVGKEMYLDDTVRTIVSGVVKDLPYNTDFTFKTFVSYITLEKTSLRPDNWDTWDNTNGAQQLYIKLSEGTTTASVEKQINDLFKKYEKKDPADHSKSWETLQPLSDVHFNGDYGVYDLPIANKPTLYGLLAVAVFLLLLGCINFINLTTAHASQRAKEIGIRKTMGSSRRQLIIQFLSETFLLTFFATLLCIVLTPLILKAFAGFIPDGLHFNVLEQPRILAFAAGLMIIVTVLSGFYPALILSGYKPVLVLKNQAYGGTAKSRTGWLRKTLTISQFVIAQVFVMASMLVGKQISYSLNKDLGFRKEAIVYMTTNYYDTVASHRYVFMNKLKAMPEVEMVSLSTNPPSSQSTWSSTMKFINGDKEIENDVQQKFGDSNYIKLYHLKLLAGKNIAQTDTVTGLLINETYARILGFKNMQDAVGRYFSWDNSGRMPIAGVVADFHQKSLHEPIKPLVIGSRSLIERNISVALKPQTEGGVNWKTALSKIEKAWKEIYPEDDFTYSFFDEDIAKYYTAEQHISSLLKWATGLAIFISCLGLLGLVIYTTGQRTKEIGIRKVLGASVSQIVSMISKEFMILVAVAFVIAAPVAWIGMSKWLENFAYRTDISWWIFLLAGGCIVLVALVTLSFQTIKAAVANPVKSLRSE